MSELRVDVEVMSGPDDGTRLQYRQDEGAGKWTPNGWTLRIGRKEDNDISLPKDSYSSRYHARLTWRAGGWWLEDSESRNGTFLESETVEEEEPRLIPNQSYPLVSGGRFRIGRTWLRLLNGEER